MGEAIKLRKLGLEAYLKPGTTARWLLPVCGSQLKDRLMRLRPDNLGNWEDTDFDGCPTMCYRLTTKQVRSLNSIPFYGAWQQLCGALGKGPAKEFFPDLWLRFNNGKARDRNRWEYHHGGIRHEKFDKGMGIREAARMSIV